MTDKPNLESCLCCGSTNIRATLVDEVSGHPCEVEYKCEECKESVAYWAYGYFEGEHHDNS